MKKACKTVGRGSAPEPRPFPRSPPLPQSQGPCARSSLHAARPHLTYGRVLGPPVPCHPRHCHTSTYGMSREGQNPQGSRRRGPRRGVYKTALTGSEYQDPRGTFSTLDPGPTAQTQPSALGCTHPLPDVRSEVTPQRDTAPLASQEPCGALTTASRGKTLTLCN